VHIFLIKPFLLEQTNLLGSFCPIMEKVNTNVIWNEFYIELYMLIRVLLHHWSQMPNDQKLNLVDDVLCMLLLIEQEIGFL